MANRRRVPLTEADLSNDLEPVRAVAPDLTRQRYTHRILQKTKEDALEYYKDMSGNHLKYLVDSEHVEPEVLTEVKEIMRRKLIQEAKEENDRMMEQQLRNPFDEENGQSYDDAQGGIKPTRKRLNRLEQAVFETGFGERYDGGIDNVSRNPLERNILFAEQYTLAGTPSYENVVMKSGRQDALGMIAGSRMGKAMAKSGMKDMYDVGVFNVNNAAPILTATRRNPQLIRVDENIPQYVDPNDFMDALFRR